MRPISTSLVFVAVAVWADSAQAEPSEPGQGAMMVIAEGIEGVRSGETALPLVRTEVDIGVDGFVARANVRQTFRNPYDVPIEAVYVFPLPHQAAVSGMTMTIGKRVIRADVQEREAARRAYEQARGDGKAAALLEQERPNMFTQSVANILPGEDIVVDLAYDDLVDYEDGEYELVYPMTVGPRYVPASVADAERITPPVAAPGTRSGRDVDLDVQVNAGVKIADLRSPTHAIAVTGSGPYTVTLADARTIPNKDFVLRWAVAGEKPQFALLTHQGDLGGFFALLLQPPASIAPEAAAPKEVVFVLDTSGSMAGTPIGIVKRAMRYAIANLNPDDTFRIVRFSNSASALSEAPLSKTEANVERALAYVDRIDAGGGTEMLTGVREAFAGAPAGGRLRMVLFMSDGYIGNETEIFDAIRDQRGPDARLFAFGVGSSVNRHLLDGMAGAGGGSAYYALLDEPPEAQVREFYQRIANPVMTHVELEWDDVEVQDASQPASIDLFVGQPLWLVGRFDEPGEGKVTVRGRVGERAVHYDVPVAFPKRAGGAAALPQLWARTMVAQTADPERITQLGLRYRIATAYTSFVAVEDRVINEGGVVHTVQVPVDMPAGVSYEGVFGTAGGEVSAIEGRAPTIDRSYAAGLPAPDASGTGFSGSTSLENEYEDSDGEGGGEMLSISSPDRRARRAFHIGGGFAIGALRDPALDESTSATLWHVRVAHEPSRRWGVGARVSMLFPGADDAERLASVLAELMYLPLLDGHLRLSLGAGLALPSESDLGPAWLAAVELPFRLFGDLDVGLQLRYDGQRLGPDRTVESIGFGFALDW